MTKIQDVRFFIIYLSKFARKENKYQNKPSYEACMTSYYYIILYNYLQVFVSEKINQRYQRAGEYYCPPTGTVGIGSLINELFVGKPYV